MQADIPSHPAAAGPRWFVHLLGSCRLIDPQGREVVPAGRASVLILARLALYPQRAHAREELIDLLWRDVDLDTGRNRLRQALSVLRGLLARGGQAPVLLADRRTVRLLPGRLHSDVQALHEALAQGRSVAAQELDELLPGHFDDWVLDERRRLAELLERHARAQPRRRPDSVASALPLYLTRSVGHEGAAVALAQAVAAHRYVLLRGPGGVGKTRLAVELARALSAPGAVPGFDRVVFVALASCTTREAMGEAVWLALRVEGAGSSDAFGAVEQALSGQRVLLVLDNFEQLVEAARGDLARWLERLPSLHLLVTSRRALRIDGEHEQVLQALPLPEVGLDAARTALNPAVALFVDRAGAVRADFHLDEATAPMVAEIVGWLEGLPLAIELAASRLRSLGLHEIWALLREALASEPESALALLDRGGPRGGGDTRHASMRAVMAWSFEHLHPAEREVVDTLAVFSGGATLEAVAAMQGLPSYRAAALLDELVAASVACWREGADARARYQLFEPVREYALACQSREKLAALRDRHFTWLVEWAGLWAGLWTGRSGPMPSLHSLRDEVANLSAGMAHAAAQSRFDEMLALASSLAGALDDVTLPSSVLDWLARAAHGSTGPLVARGHALLAEQRYEQGARELATAHAERALAALAPDDVYAADVLHAAARIRVRLLGDIAGAQILIERGLALARERHQPSIEAELLALAGIVAMQQGRDVQHKTAFDREALALWVAHGPATRVPVGMVNLALSLGFQHKPLEQLPLLAQARQQAASNGQQRLLAFINSVMGYALADLRRWDESQAAFRDCLATAWAHAAWREWFYGLWNLPRTLVCRGHAEPAALIMGFAEQFGQQRYGLLHWSDRRERRRTRRLVRGRLGADREAALWQQGRLLDMAAVMNLAMDPGLS